MHGVDLAGFLLHESAHCCKQLKKKNVKILNTVNLFFLIQVAEAIFTDIEIML
jgi:hypothetical protein